MRCRERDVRHKGCVCVLEWQECSDDKPAMEEKKKAQVEKDHRRWARNKSGVKKKKKTQSNDFSLSLSLYPCKKKKNKLVL